MQYSMLEPVNTTLAPPYLVLENQTQASDITMGDNMTLIMAPVVLLFGGFGNSVTGAVMLRKQFRKMSLGVYLFMLAMADNMTLLTNRLTGDWIKLMFGLNIRAYSDIACKSLVYAMYSSSSISSWLIVAVSVERVLVTTLPFKAKELSTRRRAGLVTGSIILSLLLLHIFIFKLVTLGKFRSMPECVYVSRTKTNGYKPGMVLELFHICIYSIIPAIILITSNITIMVKLASSYRFQITSQRGITCPSINSSIVCRTTWMLVLVSSSFVITTFPLSCVLLHALMNDIINPQEIENPLFWLKVMSHAINFLLYSVSGPAFRRELKNMCKCKRSGNSYDLTIRNSRRSVNHIVCKSIVGERTRLTHV